MCFATLEEIKKKADRYEEEVRLAKEQLDQDLDQLVQKIINRINEREYLFHMEVVEVGILERERYHLKKVIELLEGKFEQLNQKYDDYFKEIIIMKDDTREWTDYRIRISIDFRHLFYKLSKEEAATYDRLLYKIIDEEVYEALLRKDKEMMFPLKQFGKHIHTIKFNEDAKARNNVLAFVMDKLKSLGFDAAIVSKNVQESNSVLDFVINKLKSLNSGAEIVSVDFQKVNFNKLDEDTYNNDGYWLKINLE